MMPGRKSSVYTIEEMYSIGDSVHHQERTDSQEVMNTSKQSDEAVHMFTNNLSTNAVDAHFLGDLDDILNSESQFAGDEDDGPSLLEKFCDIMANDLNPIKGENTEAKIAMKESSKMQQGHHQQKNTKHLWSNQSLYKTDLDTRRSESFHYRKTAGGNEDTAQSKKNGFRKQKNISNNHNNAKKALHHSTEKAAEKTNVFSIDKTKSFDVSILQELM